MLKVIDVFPIGTMLSVTLDGACEQLHNGSRLIDKDGNEIIVSSVAMTRNDNPEDFGQSTTILVKRCSIQKGEVLSSA